MTDACPRCLMAFPRHFVVRARCAKRWRGANFDRAAAEGNVGAAVAGVLGMRVKTTAELGAFMRRVFVRSYGESLPSGPAEEFDASEGESVEFHVGVREVIDDATFAKLEDAARGAVAASRHFTLLGAAPP